MGFFDRFHKNSTPTPQTVRPLSVKKAEPATAKEASKTGEILKAKPVGGNELSARLLVRPHVSEKAAHQTSKGVYVFDVAIGAEKQAIQKAVEGLYKVKVTAVRTIRQKGKPVLRGRRPGQRKDTKKALVTLAKGQTLNIYEGV